jgi:hypothetical protein
MSSWTEVLENPEALSGYDAVPSLGDVELRCLSYANGLDCIDINLSLRELPTRRTNRWPDQTNAIALKLQFWGELRVSLSTVTPFRNPLDVHCALQKNGDGVITLECGGQGVNLSIECRAARIAGLEGYIRTVSGSLEDKL